MKRLLIATVVVCAFGWTACGRAVQFPAQNGVAVSGDNPVGRAFKNRKSNVQVEGEGVVIRLLEDDDAGDRHQRFIIRVAADQTVLIAHNVDVAPRVAGLRKDDQVGFCGEYIWSEKGGVVHWTHHDPNGRHAAGWIKHNGRIYQ